VLHAVYTAKNFPNTANNNTDTLYNTNPPCTYNTKPEAASSAAQLTLGCQYYATILLITAGPVGISAITEKYILLIYISADISRQCCEATTALQATQPTPAQPAA